MKALIICFSDLSRDPRVRRQIKWLSDMGFQLTTIGDAPSGQEDCRHFSSAVPPPKSDFIRKVSMVFKISGQGFERYYWNQPKIKHCSRILESLRQENFDLVVANDIDCLPLAIRYKNSKLLFDAHEYYPEQRADEWKWRLFFRKGITAACRQAFPHVDGFTAVNQAIAKKFSDEFGIPLPKVVTNASSYCDLSPTITSEDTIRLIHHGIGNPSRGIDMMIRLFNTLDDRFRMDLILIPGDKKYIDRIKKIVEKTPRIRCLSPLPFDEIIPFLNRYDIGLFFFKPIHFNIAHCLPNKFFEFIQARLAIAIGPTSEMKRHVDHYRCGVVSSDFDPRSLAARLNALSSNDIMEMKRQACMAARELNAEISGEVFKQAVKEAL